MNKINFDVLVFSLKSSSGIKFTKIWIGRKQSIYYVLKIKFKLETQPKHQKSLKQLSGAIKVAFKVKRKDEMEQHGIFIVFLNTKPDYRNEKRNIIVTNFLVPQQMSKESWITVTVLNGISCFEIILAWSKSINEIKFLKIFWEGCKKFIIQNNFCIFFFKFSKNWRLVTPMY